MVPRRGTIGGPTPVESLYTEWQDVNGTFYRSRNYMVAGTDPTNYLTQLQALVLAGLQQETHGGVTTFTAVPPTTGVYDAVYQVGQVTYTTSGANAIRIMLPALIAANLLANGIVIDPAALAAFDAEVLAAITDNLGNLATVRTTAVLTDRRNDLQ
jgi:hypothetical protein